LVQNKEQLFDQLFRDYKEKLYRLCFSYCNNKTVAEDLLQESFSKIWLHLESFKQECSYSTWMYRIAANTCLMYLRSSKINPIILQETFYDAANTEPYNEEPVNELNNAIGQLEEIDRLIISMVLQELSYREIGEVLGISENNVGVKVHRIKAALKILLQKKVYHG
jgi:RNA polymerase sigma-70 factor (ECF subfamily)